jgi:hypothetical protein
MGRASRDKGKRGERELASALRQLGFAARRSQQYCGSSGDADLVGMPGLHIECKRAERLELYGAMAQAIGDAAPGEAPVVMHRRNNCGWLAVMRLEDFCALYRECGRL